MEFIQKEKTYVNYLGIKKLNPMYFDKYRRYPDSDYYNYSIAERIFNDGGRWIYDIFMGFVL